MNGLFKPTSVGANYKLSYLNTNALIEQLEDIIQALLEILPQDESWQRILIRQLNQADCDIKDLRSMVSKPKKKEEFNRLSHLLHEHISESSMQVEGSCADKTSKSAMRFAKALSADICHKD